MAGRKQSKQQGPALIGYARVSTPEQSLDMQVQALERFGVPRHSIHVEKVSGAASRRPILDGLISSLRSDDQLIVWRLDRISRSTRDALEKIDHISDIGARLVSLTESIDTSTAMGRAMMTFAFVFSEMERNIIVERTQSGVKAAMERGVKFGQPPKLSPKEMARAQRLRDKGWSLAKIGKEFDVAPGTIRNWTAGPGRTRRRPKR